MPPRQLRPRAARDTNHAPDHSGRIIASTPVLKSIRASPWFHLEQYSRVEEGKPRITRRAIPRGLARKAQQVAAPQPPAGRTRPGAGTLPGAGRGRPALQGAPPPRAAARIAAASLAAAGMTSLAACGGGRLRRQIRLLLEAASAVCRRRAPLAAAAGEARPAHTALVAAAERHRRRWRPAGRPARALGRALSLAGGCRLCRQIRRFLAVRRLHLITHGLGQGVRGGGWGQGVIS